MLVMLLNRELQNQILQIAASCYPSQANQELNELYEHLKDQELAANLRYLEQHGLIESESFLISLDGFYSFNGVTITNIGMDFLADDGGLSAILGVVTIKFEANQLKLLLESKIIASNLPPERKQSMIDVLRELPAESIKHLTTKIVDTGYDNLDSLMSLIQSSLF